MPSLEENKKRFMMQKAKERFMAKKKGPEKFSQLEAGLRAGAQGLSFGSSDEIAAGVGTGFGMLGDYDKMLADQRRQDQGSAGQWPKTAMAGEVAGSLVGAAVPGAGQVGASLKAAKLAKYLQSLKAAKALQKGGKMAGLAGKPAQAIGRAGASGAAYGAGTSEESLTDNPMGLAADIGKGAVTGAAMQGAIGGIAGKMRAAPKGMKNVAEEAAVKHFTGQNKKGLKQIGKANKTPEDYGKFEKTVNRAGRDILDEVDPVTGEKMLRAGERVQGSAAKAHDAVTRYGDDIGKIGVGVDAAMPGGTGVNVKNVIQDLEDYAKTIPKIGGAKNRRKGLEEVIEDLKTEHPKGKMGFKDAQLLKNQFKFDRDDADSLISNKDVSNKINRIISNHMDESVSGFDKKIKGGKKGLVGGDRTKTVSKSAYDKVEKAKPLLEKYGEIKGKYGTMKEVSRAATDRSIGNFTNRKPSPSDYAIGGISTIASAATGDPSHMLFGLMAAGGHKLVRERGNATTARVLDNLVKAFDNAPPRMKKYADILIKAGERGPAAIAATHQALKKKPEYNEYMEEYK